MIEPGASHPSAASAGLGLKPAHFDAVLADAARGVGPGFVELHPQNYMMAGGPMIDALDRIAAALPVSFHSVGLSLGDPAGVDEEELERLAMLCENYQPFLVSDHLAFTSLNGEKFPDLLPFPMTEESLDHFARQVDKVQQRLGRQFLVENPSRMVAFAGDRLEESDFLSQLVERTGCGLLIDVNNLLVTEINLGKNAAAAIETLPPHAIGEIHVAGHSVEDHGEDGRIAIDDHGSPVSEECWALLDRLLHLSGPGPVLVERDNDVPEYDELSAEVAHAQRLLDRAAIRESARAA